MRTYEKDRNYIHLLSLHRVTQTQDISISEKTINVVDPLPKRGRLRRIALFSYPSLYVLARESASLDLIKIQWFGYCTWS